MHPARLCKEATMPEKTNKGYVRLYPPTGGDDYIEAREDQVERYIRNGWKKKKQKAAQSANKGE